MKLKVNGLVNTPDHVYFVKDSTEIFPTHQNYGFVYMSAQTFQDAMHVDVTYNKAYVDVDTQSHVSSVKKEIQKAIMGHDNPTTTMKYYAHANNMQAIKQK